MVAHWVFGSDAVVKNRVRNFPRCDDSACSMLATNWVCKTTHLTRHTCSNEEQQKRDPQNSPDAFDSCYHSGCTRRNVAPYHFHSRPAHPEDIVDRRRNWADFFHNPEAEAGSESTLIRRCEERNFARMVRLLTSAATTCQGLAGSRARVLAEAGFGFACSL